MNKIIQIIQKIGMTMKKMMILLTLFLVICQNHLATVFAAEKTEGGLENDKVVTGVKNLIGDASKVVLIIGIPACGLLATYFFVRKANADEQDQKIWKNRISYAIIAAIGMTVIGGLLNTILSYFK